MAPDLEKRRQEVRRSGSATLDHVSDHLGMLLQYGSVGGTLTDVYRHGSNAGGTSSTVTASSRSAATNRTPATRRVVNHPQRQQQQQPQRQQQQQQQQQQKQSSLSRLSLSSLSSFSGATPRNSDEHGPRTTQDNDNSNDSGLGSEERQQHFSNINLWNGVGEEDSKRRKMDIKLESEDANFSFPEVAPGTSPENKPARTTVNGINLGAISSGARTGSGGSVSRVIGVTRPRPAMGVLTKRAATAHQGPVTLTSQLSNISADGKAQLQIVCQPEQQHRARYQTEGSRGAVKDRSGNGFPIVRLIGYDKPTTLQVFIGTDLGRVLPHMFYQACRVSGKNSTPCVERKIDGTIVIEIDMEPTKDITCDCVGILKERNVDVEHRFPQEAGLLQGRSKKKSTRCRMVFRTSITHADGTTETLQVCSQPIVCTQPPGIPEICKKSLTSCPCTGGLELIILGKNFLKDTRVVFQLDSDNISNNLEPHWECTVLPDKEYLHPAHLVCVVPAYRRQDLAPTETVSIKLYAMSSGKTSEPHTFLYTAASTPPQPSIGKVESISSPLMNGDAALATPPAAVVPLATAVASNTLITQTTSGPASFLTSPPTQPQQATSSEILKSDPSPPPTGTSQVTPVMMWTSQSSNCHPNSPPDVMMPPPALVTNPLINRRSSSSLQLILPDNLKTEVLDENSENSMLSENSMPSIPTPTTAANGPASVTSPLQQLVNENSREAAPSQTDIIRTVTTANNSPVREVAVNGLLGVVDLIRNQHSLSMVAAHHPTSFGGMHESNQVQVLSPHRLKDNVLPTENSSNGTALQNAGVVDLRMKHHHHQDFGSLSTFPGTSGTQPLSGSGGHVVDKYLSHMDSSVTATEESDSENGFAIQQQASIIPGSSQQSATPPGILANTGQTSVKLDALVNSAAEQMVSPLRSVNSNPAILSHVTSEHEAISNGQQTRTSPSIPVKLLEALIPAQTVQPLAAASSATTVSPTATVSPAATLVEPTGESLLINAALLPQLPETPVNATTVASNSTVTASAMPTVAAEHMQIQALTQQEVQQVEQVVAQAQQQVEQVVAHAQQQAVQAVQQAQQQVVQQVVQHAQVVQQAVQQVQAVQHVQATELVQQAVQQATQEVVQQAVQQATQEVVQQVHAVQQAVQQAQAAQVMQQAVQQDINSMLSQPAGFVAEASSVLASGAAQEISQQRLTNEAEQAINNVITNATKDILNNRSITTTTAHAIIATKKILNSVATQSAQLMNNAMEGILPKSPPTQSNIVEQVASKSPPVALPVSPSRQAVNAPIPNPAAATVVKKPEDGMLPQELTSMSDHDLLSYINPSCFEQGFLL